MADVEKKLSVDEQYELITRNLQEVLGGEQLRKRLQEAHDGGKPVSLYWGTATTGRPHTGYLVPLAKIADFLQAGIKVRVLLADIHAFLDNLKAPIELVQQRVKYYSRIIHTSLKAIGVPTEKLEFIVGSSYQLEANYNMDKYKLAALTSEHDARKAGAEVVKQTSNAPLSGLIYPLLQCLDEEYLGVDIQFGGVDQRKIFTYAMETLPRLGYKSRVHLMNGMVPGLQGGKMSASEANSKIDFLDTPKDIKKKINSAEAVEGVSEGNGLLAFAEAVLNNVSSIQTSQNKPAPFAHPDAPANTVFTIDRPEQHGGKLHYESFFDLRKSYDTKELHPADLKKGITDALVKLLEPIRQEFESDPEFQEIERLAYPPPPPPEKKKKEKKVNPRFAHLIAEKEQKKAENKQQNQQEQKPEHEHEQAHQENGIDMNNVKESLPQ